MKIFLTSLMIFLMAISASAQFADEAKIEEINQNYSFGIKPAVTPFSLLDLSRIKWSHSYSVGFFSGGNGSGSMGLLNTTMFYDFSSKLSLSLNLGIAHNTGAIWGDGSSEANFLPGFTLDYHPSKNFRMSIGMQHYSGYMNPYYYNPYHNSLNEF